MKARRRTAAMTTDTGDIRVFIDPAVTDDDAAVAIQSVHAPDYAATLTPAEAVQAGQALIDAGRIADHD